MAQENPTMEKNKVDKVMEYILNTPENTNPAILKSMLEDLSSEGGSGESDFSTATITIKASNGAYSGLTAPQIDEVDGAYYGTVSADETDYNITVPLYMGKCTAEFWGDLEVNGDIVKGESTLTITGDGTITFISTAPTD